MELDPEVSVAIYTAFNERDVANFRRLLAAHPEFLRHPDDTDRWMWQAALDGHLPLVECLSDLGQDVNEPKDAVDPDDPDCSFCQVEGRSCRPRARAIWSSSGGCWRKGRESTSRSMATAGA